MLSSNSHGVKKAAGPEMALPFWKRPEPGMYRMVGVTPMTSGTASQCDLLRSGCCLTGCTKTVADSQVSKQKQKGDNHHCKW